MCDDLSFINTTQKTLKPSKKNVSTPSMDEKKLHTREFQLKGSEMRWDASCFKKGLLEKQHCFKHLRYIAIEKDILSELNRCIFSNISKVY